MIVRIICFAISLHVQVGWVGAFTKFRSTAFHNVFPTLNPSNERNEQFKTISTYNDQETHSRSRRTQTLFSTRNKPSTSSNNGVTSTLISQLAVVALKVRLAKQSGVSCDVTASSKDLFLNSSVGPVTVRGRGWQSPLGLTCRAIDATVETCKLDMNKVISNRKLILITPAVGKAMVALNSDDFGSFLTHPLLTSQSPSLSTPLMASLSSSRTFEFSGRNVEICQKGDFVVFYGNCIGENWQCHLIRGGNASKRAKIQVSHVPSLETNSSIDVDAIELELSELLTEFFNDIVFELDGTFLSFEDMKIHTPKEKGGANVLMALGISVKKFPSPGVAF